MLYLKAAAAIELLSIAIRYKNLLFLDFAIFKEKSKVHIFT